MKRALDGIRVLAFTQGLAGPWAGLLLGSCGAEVIKVESARAVDTFRRFGAAEAPPRFLEYNRNVLSISVDLKRPQGIDLIKQLVKLCDIVLDNFSAPVLGKLGLDYPDLRAIKEDIIVVRMPGFGTFGPKRDWKSWGQTLNAFTGLLHLWRYPDDPTPAGSQTPLVDYLGGVVAACTAMAALLDRHRTGEGHLIDLSQAETMGYFMGISYLRTLFEGIDPDPEGNACSYAFPQDCFACRGDDRWCAITVETEDQWKALCRVIDREDITRDPRFASVVSRSRNAYQLHQIIAQWTSSRDAHEAMELLQAASVPCGVVQTGEDLMKDPHLRSRQFTVQVEHPSVGRLTYPGLPFRMSETSAQPTQLAPELGQHNEYVFGKLLGLLPEEIRKLQDNHILS